MREAQRNKQASAPKNPKTNGPINVWKWVAVVLIALIVGTRCLRRHPGLTIA